MKVEQKVIMSNDNQNLDVNQTIEGGQTSASPIGVFQKASSSQSNADKKWELEKQLHEQYAINNNAHNTSFISFVIALFALFGALGYVFVKNSFNPNGEYSLDIFLILASFVSGILLFLASLCVQIGYAQRRDQIIIEKFRKEYELFVYNNTKGKGYCEFLPDYYNQFFWLFFAAQIGVLLLTIIRSLTICDGQEICLCFTVAASIFLQVIAIGASFWIRGHYFKKYNDFPKQDEEKSAS